MAVPWLRLLVIGLSLQRHEIYPRSVHVSFVVGKVAPWQDFVRVLLFTPVTITPPMLHTQFHLHVTLTRKTNQRTPGTFQNPTFFFFFRRSGTDDRNVLSLFFMSEMDCSGGYLSASHEADPSSIAGHSMWDLWWKTWRSFRFFLEYLVSCQFRFTSCPYPFVQLSIPFHQLSIPIRPSQSLQKPSNWRT
jgi:hypothetical protein